MGCSEQWQAPPVEDDLDLAARGPPHQALEGQAGRALDFESLSHVCCLRSGNRSQLEEAVTCARDVNEHPTASYTLNDSVLR